MNYLLDVSLLAHAITWTTVLFGLAYMRWSLVGVFIINASWSICFINYGFDNLTLKQIDSFSAVIGLTITLIGYSFYYTLRDRTMWPVSKEIRETRLMNLLTFVFAQFVILLATAQG